ncbi:MAG: ABC transporter substrate-binding protein [Deltaproteobacteria bacterium]|nr:ABC transporter substrate-binding protein [Deltaproteobacteria bacterium]
MKLHARFSLAAIIFVLGAVAPSAAQNLKIPFASLSPTYSPLWIAAEAGYFKKHGLEVQPVYISSGSLIVPALLSGQIEIANMSSAPPLTAWARGAELICVGVTSNRLLHVVVTRAPLKKPEELKGLKLGSDRYGSLSDLVLRDVLRHFNLTPDRDVAILQAGGLPERLGALKAGAVDGAILTGDTALQAEKLGFHLAVEVSRLPILYPGSTIIVTRSYIQNKRDVLKRFLRSWIEGIKAARTDKELTVTVLQKYLKTADRGNLDRLFEIYKDVHEKIPAPDAKVMGGALKQLAATIPQAGQLKVEDFIDRSLIGELESEGFIAKLYSGR